MLKINLLPIRQLKKRAKARNQIAAGIVIFTSVLVLLGLVGDTPGRQDFNAQR